MIIRISLAAHFAEQPSNLNIRFPSGHSSDPYCRLINDQTSIGWDHFLRGKLSTEWTPLQHLYAKKYNLLDESDRWIPTLIRFMSTITHGLWKKHNSSRHGQTGATQTQANILQAQCDVTSLYSFRHLVLQQDQDLFYASLELHLLEPFSKLRAWLTLNKCLIEYSVRTARTQAKLSTRNIQEYLTKPCRLPQRLQHRKPRKHPKKRTTFPMRMTTYFEVHSTTRAHIPHARPVSPDTVSLHRHPHFLQSYLADFFPDHPS